MNMLSAASALLSIYTVYLTSCVVTAQQGSNETETFADKYFGGLETHWVALIGMGILVLLLFTTTIVIICTVGSKKSDDGGKS